MSSKDYESDMSRQPFLEKSREEHSYQNDNINNLNDKYNDEEDYHIQQRKPRLSGRYITISILIHVLLIAIYTVTSWIIIQKSVDHTRNKGPGLLYSPASGAVKWETRPVDGLRNDSIYAQKPSPKVDAAWHELLENINLRITPPEMAQLGHTSLAFTDGSGYLGTLGVYHELHCLKRLRHWIYKDYYYPHMTPEEELEHYTHADHCLELMRQASVCKGDVSVTPFKWLHGKGVEPTTQEGILHQCVNWESLSGWAKGRRVDLFDPELLIRPGREGEIE